MSGLFVHVLRGCDLAALGCANCDVWVGEIVGSVSEVCERMSERDRVSSAEVEE